MPGQRLLAKLDLFDKDTVDVILSDSKYRTPHFARQYIECWSEVAFVDVGAGKRLAETAEKLVGLLEPDERLVLSPHAMGILGSSYRILGDLESSWETLHKALDSYKSEELPLADEADLLRRIAYLNKAMKLWGKALESGDESAKLCRRALSENNLGLALFAKASIYFDMIREGKDVSFSAVAVALGETIGHIDFKLFPRIADAAVTNLSLTLIQKRTSLSPTEMRQILRGLARAKRQMAKLRIRQKSVPGAKLMWATGLLWRCAGALDLAQSLLSRARRRLNGHPDELILISIDLSEALMVNRQWGRLRIMVEELLSFDKVYNERTITILAAWRKGIMEYDITPTVWSDLIIKLRGYRNVGKTIDESHEIIDRSRPETGWPLLARPSGRDRRVPRSDGEVDDSEPGPSPASSEVVPPASAREHYDRWRAREVHHLSADPRDGQAPRLW